MAEHLYTASGAAAPGAGPDGGAGPGGGPSPNGGARDGGAKADDVIDVEFEEKK